MEVSQAPVLSALIFEATFFVFSRLALVLSMGLFHDGRRRRRREPLRRSFDGDGYVGIICGRGV
jgi:hypothetical protein